MKKAQSCKQPACFTILSSTLMFLRINFSAAFCAATYRYSYYRAY